MYYPLHYYVYSTSRWFSATENLEAQDYERERETGKLDRRSRRYDLLDKTPWLNVDERERFNLHPWRLTWNIIIEVCFRSFSFLFMGEYVASMSIFQGVLTKIWWLMINIRYSAVASMSIFQGVLTKIWWLMINIRYSAHSFWKCLQTSPNKQ